MTARRPYDVALLEVPATRGASRVKDPQTARDAGRSMSGDVLRQQQALVLSAFLPQPTACAYEVWLRLRHRMDDHAPKENVIARRLGELAELGMVRLTKQTRPGSSSRLQRVYEASDKGLEWLRMQVTS